MSTGQTFGHVSRPAATKHTPHQHFEAPPPTLTPENVEQEFEPCAATASFLLYSQRNIVLVLHHDTLAIERRFDLHREDVLWVHVDNSSERGSGRLAVSYDAGNTAIVWDILTGGEVARFSSYEHIRTASFMRNGNIAFGNNQGNVILFEPSTSEHLSARTIYDPVTALAPSSDCRTFAIGYLNGSILIATLQPSFTILHTLTTTKAPSRISGLAWHGSSSKQRTDMLATQTSDGDLRVWSVPKVPHQEQPTIIRVLQRAELQAAGPCWFAWSKNGRIVQHAEGETRSWDVRTKKVTYELIPTIDNVAAITNYGPTATLFALGRTHTVQQYDITPGNAPTQVASVQHVPSNTPPTPPNNLEEGNDHYGEPRTALSTEAPVLPIYSDVESSADEAGPLSPLQKIAQEMDSLDALESEIRDKVMPLSPVSSRASSVSSRSSRGSRRNRKYLYDKPDSSRASESTGFDGTEFSFGDSVRQGHESMSIRSVSSYASRPQHRSSGLRNQMLRSPEEAKDTSTMDLFQFTRARLRDVAFRTPHYGTGPRTPELLQREMLSVVFGWNGDIQSLIRDELSRHKPGSASGVLLSKWLGDIAADNMASMIGSESMTSSDWMLLALSSIGQDSQKKVGEAFVQRLLEKGDVHPAVAILLGLGEHNDGIEVYVSQCFWLEAVLLTCLTCPADWGRQSFLIRKWGENAVQQGQAELAVRCFSCTSIETSEPWFSPRAQQDIAYAQQQQRLTGEPLSAESGPLTSPPISPPSRSGSGRLTAKNASLKLITTFGDRGVPTSAPQVGATPIAESALSPGGQQSWRQNTRNARDNSEARTATPGGFSRRKRLPSKSDIERAKMEAAEMATPMNTARDQASRVPSKSSHSRRTSASSSVPEPATAVKPSTYQGLGMLAPPSKDDNHLPSPSEGVFAMLKEQSKTRHRTDSRDRKPEGLSVEVLNTRENNSTSSAAIHGHGASTYDQTPSASLYGEASPPPTGNSTKYRAVDEYISSVEEARNNAREDRARSRAGSRAGSRAQSRARGETRTRRGTSRGREPSETRSHGGRRYIKPAKRSPSSPVPMSPEEIAKASQRGSRPEPEPATTDDEAFYKSAAPTDPHRSPRSVKSGASKKKSPENEENVSSGNVRGRSASRHRGKPARSPSKAESEIGEQNLVHPEDRVLRFRARSSSRRPSEDLQSRRAVNRQQRARSSSRQPSRQEDFDPLPVSDLSNNTGDDNVSETSFTAASESGRRKPRGLSRKELAARELEQRRLSLARRPSAPSIPFPDQGPTPGSGTRPGMGSRSHTELGDSPTSYLPPMSRSHTVDPESMSKYNKKSGSRLPAIGLPATPRAMRHPRYMSENPSEEDRAPPVPEIPGNFSELSSLGGSLTGSSLSHATGSNISSQVSSSLYSADQPQEGDDLGPLLPSTVFGQKLPQGLDRSASAPPEKMSGNVHPLYNGGLPSSFRRHSGGRGHIRKISPPDVAAQANEQMGPFSIDEALNPEQQQQVVIIPEEDEGPPPPMLPQLQHLAGPPPPPPPPVMFQQNNHSGSDVIDIAIDNNHIVDVPETLPASTFQTLPATTFPNTLPTTTYPAPMERANTASPSMHRRGRGSVSESFGSRFRGVTDRMRSQSRAVNHTKQSSVPDSSQARPYETVLPPMPNHHDHGRRESFSRAKSPYEQAMAHGGQEKGIPPPPPPPPAPPGPGMEGRIYETAIPPTTLPQSRSQSAMGYRNPKEIRANMPPETLQQGVYQPTSFL
ncbi:hypothetical protein KC352_g220 [Hortaea werneckii]|uniref:Gem-associated protein 5 TPR domain-containing protein n=1 Tax=Hortaea werneckii EXF-2000 TaxID=1157616 RepID=A0A1Z5TK84_HORWE|nr:hypothetical protein KC358_g1455 [Hortaea werneckii]OTA36417.1 hypothetical protein BTJ68_03453 [Hortaea werneckii EXF-2000]KAI6943409.1 hypothetical protein KC341_g1514 [Hortaea werneckii]KAI6951023.1 hypothetical protein KC348_g318 [Hortaea werneckii]KAI6982909.1 hypothetical protein KC321_g367 [Hortaea werneckii]